MHHERGDARPGPSAHALLRPRRAVVTQLGLAVLALVVPLGTTLLVLAIPAGNSEAVLLGTALVVVIGVLLAGLYLTSYVRVWATGEVESRFLGQRTIVHADELASILVLHVYQGLTLDTSPRVFAMDGQGRVLLRLSGQVYDLRELEAVASDLDLPFTEQERVLTMAELRDTRRAILPWYERSRIGFTAALALATVGAGAALLALMILTGVPLSPRL